jgi:hypothetical protein
LLGKLTTKTLASGLLLSGQVKRIQGYVVCRSIYRVLEFQVYFTTLYLRPPIIRWFVLSEILYLRLVVLSEILYLRDK